MRPQEKTPVAARFLGFVQIQVFADWAVVVLLDDFHDYGAIGLLGLRQNPVFCAAPVQLVLVMAHLFSDGSYGVGMLHVLFELEMQGLTDASRLDPFHRLPPLKCLAEKKTTCGHQPDLRR